MQSGRFIYVPVEPYIERWTGLQSCVDGTFETCLREAHIPYTSIRPDTRMRQITSGPVLDHVERSKWAFAQVLELQQMMRAGEVTSNDAIYIEDFWQPGMEMLPYAMSMVFGDAYHDWPRIYSFCHAQSVDRNDFTHTMAWWMRSFERAWADVQTHIFTAAPELREMMYNSHPSMVSNTPITPIGHIWHGETVKQLVGINPAAPQFSTRENAVVYSSRWDGEKNPGVFAQLIKLVMRDREDITFHVCTGSPELRSNVPALVELARVLKEAFPNHFFVHAGLSKHEYFKRLAKSKVQFNCARQDFVSITLLDATLMGCAPLYPNWLTFPGALNYQAANLYRNEDPADAKAKLYALLDNPIGDYSWVYQKHESSLLRAARIMGFDVAEVPSLEDLNSRRR